jgi:maltooligosyltrehalose trehalohydrolase
VKWGYLFQGQHCKWQQKLRGASTFGIPAARFVTYLENHDQVANSTRGFRLIQQSSPGCYRAMVALWLLAPQTPMLFQGQELGSTRPFVYFSDHADPLASQVRKGRGEELSGFQSTQHPELAEFLPDPSSSESFHLSVLDNPGGYRVNPYFQLFQDLLRLRREDGIFRSQRADLVHGAILGSDALVLRFQGEREDCRLVVVNLGRDLYPTPNSEPLLAPPTGMDWTMLWFSEHPRYNGTGMPPLAPGTPWRAAGHCAVVLAPRPGPARPELPGMGSTQGEDFDVHPALRQERREERNTPAVDSE